MSTSSGRLTPARTFDRGFDPDGTERVSHVAEQRSVGRASRMALALAVVLVAVAGATVGAALPALAIGAPDTVGTPGGDGENATCRADSASESSDCDAVGEDGADGQSVEDFR